MRRVHYLGYGITLSLVTLPKFHVIAVPDIDNNHSSNDNGNYSHNSMNSNDRMNSNNHGV